MLSTAALTTGPRSLMARLQTLPDVRKPRGVRHPYGTVLTIALAAIAVGCTSLLAMGNGPAGLPKNNWPPCTPPALKVATLLLVNPPSGAPCNGVMPRPWIDCWPSGWWSRVIAQTAVDEKSNEIPAMQPLLIPSSKPAR